ncbi:hypothetical protein [Chitinophaga niabensis]|uniref:Lipocalin-like domain-containing protein n=1 Tax=Chitinophaga niabensis TaxID=536979 RepID=A0A1N6D8A8_9BACT|nr:hypothetical protein [Chitinophaga niabensis]SIN67030.1 hypothetical protein SAMN04488055_0446 [Chitinophaga niabensis]
MKYLLSGIAIVLMACGSGKTNTLLKNKKWKVYDVTIPAKDGYNAVQVTQAKDLKNGYYSDAYYQFLDNGLFIATIAGQPDSGRYNLLSNGSIISITAANGDRNAEHLVEVVKLSDELFDMKVASGDYHFILRTRKQ